MPRRAEADPRQRLARVVERLGRRNPYVTLAEVARAAERPSARLGGVDVPALLEACVAESLLLKDRRTFYDRRAGTFEDRWVYRVNPRHPLVAAMLAEDPS